MYRIDNLDFFYSFQNLQVQLLKENQDLCHLPAFKDNENLMTSMYWSKLVFCNTKDKKILILTESNHILGILLPMMLLSSVDHFSVILFLMAILGSR